MRDKDKQAAALEKVGEHKSFQSGEEFLDSSSDAEAETNEKTFKPVSEDIKSLNLLKTEFD